jgi:hypothetical protein
MAPSQAFTSYSLYMWLLLVALFSSSVLPVDGDELTSVKDAIFATKTNDVMAVGLFESKNDPGYEEFKAASDTFQGKEAMKMTYSFTKEVLERYQEETQGRCVCVCRTACGLLAGMHKTDPNNTNIQSEESQSIAYHSRSYTQAQTHRARHCLN